MILVVLLLAVVSSAFSVAADENIVTYGELIVDNDVKESARSHWLNISWGADTSDPLLDTQNVSLTYREVLVDYFFVGVAYRKYFSEKSPLLNRIESDLSLLGAEIDAERADYSYYFLTGAIPLAGKLNFFGFKTLPFYFSLSFGVGERFTVEGNKYSGYSASIESSLLFTKYVGLSLSYDYEAEAAFQSRKTINRDQLNIGLFSRF